MIFDQLNFKHYHRVESKLSSICPWRFMAENGICYLKGDALMCVYEFVAPDLGSSSMAKINSISNLFNNCIVQLGENWTIQFELQRRINKDYPASDIDSLSTYLVEREREINYSYVNTHYTNRYFLIFTYKMPKMIEMKSSSFFFRKKNGQKSEETDSEIIEKEIRFFKSATSKTASVLRTAMEIKMLNSSELVSFIHSSVSFRWHKMIVPEAERSVFLDRIITDETLENSIPLKLGQNYASVIAVNAFPSATIPAMFDELNKADCELRWSTRFMCYSKQTALKKIKKKGDAFHGSVTSVGQMVINSVTHDNSGGTENRNALAQEDDSLNAGVEVTMENIGYGDYCSNIMVWDNNIKETKRKAEYIQEIVTSTGFSCKEETVNLLNAFLSMQPGNIYSNKRELFVSTKSTSHVIPISSIWEGLSSNPFMHKVTGNSCPLVVCETDFVAKNDKFLELLSTAAETIVASDAATVEEALALATAEGTLNDTFVNAVATIGEKITLRRFEILTKGDDEFFGAYTHQGGRIVAVTVVKGGDAQVAKNMAMQVASMNPSYISRNYMPQEVVDHEREVQVALLEKDEKLASKPEKVKAGIIEGRISKSLQDMCLVDQEYFLDSDQKCGQYLKANGAEVVKFVKYVVGEGIEKKDDNFAAEVAAMVK